ncbi:MAG: flagellar motor switch protein FliM [Alphaproteobacteria bacterium]|nr:flagellar motor switch protein FliM [Alphaproteobacteria bacterium]
MGGNEEVEEGDVSFLEQGEIDSILGLQQAEGEEKSGLHLLLESSKVGFQRLPGLEATYERFVRLASSSLRHFSAENVEINFDNLNPTRFGAYLNSVALPAMVAIFKAEEWEGFGLINVSSQLIYSVMDVLLGGRRSSQVRVEGRAYSVIEINIIERLISVILENLAIAFGPFSAVNFHYERMETNPRFASVALPTNATTVARFHVDIEDRTGSFEIVIPYSTLEPIRPQLSQLFMGENFGDDTNWSRHFTNVLKYSNVEIEAVLHERNFSMNDIMTWGIGSVIDFDVPADQLVTIRSGKTKIYRGMMGEKDGHVAVKLMRRLESNSGEE